MVHHLQEATPLRNGLRILSDPKLPSRNPRSEPMSDSLPTVYHGALDSIARDGSAICPMRQFWVQEIPFMSNNISYLCSNERHMQHQLDDFRSHVDRRLDDIAAIVAHVEERCKETSVIEFCDPSLAHQSNATPTHCGRCPLCWTKSFLGNIKKRGLSIKALCRSLRISRRDSTDSSVDDDRSRRVMAWMRSQQDVPASPRSSPKSPGTAAAVGPSVGQSMRLSQYAEIPDTSRAPPLELEADSAYNELSGPDLTLRSRESATEQLSPICISVSPMSDNLVLTEEYNPTTTPLSSTTSIAGLPEMLSPTAYEDNIPNLGCPFDYSPTDSDRSWSTAEYPSESHTDQSWSFVGTARSSFNANPNSIGNDWFSGFVLENIASSSLSLPVTSNGTDWLSALELGLGDLSNFDPTYAPSPLVVLSNLNDTFSGMRNNSFVDRAAEQAQHFSWDYASRTVLDTRPTRHSCPSWFEGQTQSLSSFVVDIPKPRRLSVKSSESPEAVCCMACNFFPSRGPDQMKKIRKHRLSRKHRRISTGVQTTKDEELFPCLHRNEDGSTCSAVYNRRDNLRGHQRKKHSRPLNRMSDSLVGQHVVGVPGDEVGGTSEIRNSDQWTWYDDDDEAQETSWI
ncbi:hypothetical protein B0T17DRAFT_519135 [Bombardia bombarda]|uniref:Uncharacterized protein n=1 Tax=Bombardia bombarda TaxID=252184 RepID=A0AA39XM29_9PEZI|nr:hypothetical protein B0T17DRAFT_519135 [Bombardia bombarda]